jgi:type I restriction enzyme, S subunit
MERYPAYKDSGVEWLAEIPIRWDILRLKYSSGCNTSNVDKLSKEGETNVCLCNYTDVYKNDRIHSEMEFMLATATQSEIEKFQLKKGDVLITKDSETPDDIAIPAYVVEDIEKVLCGYHLALLRSYKGVLNGFYLYYLFKSYKFNQQFTIAANGITRFGLSIDDVRNSSISIPNMSEQIQISTFLDHKTRQIDDLISKKQKLIELLKEERIALINHAVTKGLDPTVSMQDSGIDYFGEVPEHWKLTTLKKITNKIGSGVTPTGGAEIYVESGIPFFRSQNIHFNGIRTEEIAYIPTGIHENMSASKIYKGDVLLNITGASIGRCCVYEGQLGEANVNQHVCILRPTNLVNPYFLYYFLYSEIGQIQIELGVTGSGREGLNFKNIGNFIFPMISSDEQIQIVQYLNEMSNRIETVITKANREIELFSEYKTSLINEAVTGKIDVRDYQIRHA